MYKVEKYRSKIIQKYGAEALEGLSDDYRELKRFYVSGGVLPGIFGTFRKMPKKQTVIDFINSKIENGEKLDDKKNTYTNIIIDPENKLSDNGATKVKEGHKDFKSVDKENLHSLFDSFPVDGIFMTLTSTIIPNPQLMVVEKPTKILELYKTAAGKLTITTLP